MCDSRSFTPITRRALTNTWFDGSAICVLLTFDSDLRAFVKRWFEYAGSIVSQIVLAEGSLYIPSCLLPASNEE
ncbi:hypothetical protein RRG08_049624 [Elysia crispata]|uniref:Uncharacterized protein n=1 Tax=Elysia crispata TaxID=231223 RepID=A0AAE1AV15_9GAST|nr:hypothetical protein RRG08_049624 [Elysia crispata]